MDLMGKMERLEKRVHRVRQVLEVLGESPVPADLPVHRDHLGEVLGDLKEIQVSLVLLANRAYLEGTAQTDVTVTTEPMGETDKTA